MRKVLIEKKKRIFDDFFKIDEALLSYEQFDGRMSPVVRRLNFERGDAVSALIFNPKRQVIILVNQFKYPTFEKGPGWITETVAGMINENENTQDAIRREVLEETGYEVSTAELISTFYVSPGGTSERIFLYYVEVDDNNKTSEGGGLAEENEDIINVEMSLDEAIAKFKNGEIIDAKTIIAVLWLKSRHAEAEVNS